MWLFLYGREKFFKKTVKKETQKLANINSYKINLTQPIRLIQSNSVI